MASVPLPVMLRKQTPDRLTCRNDLSGLSATSVGGGSALPAEGPCLYSECHRLSC